MTIAALTFHLARSSKSPASSGSDAGHDGHDAAGAILELLGPGLHVDHQIAVRLADTDHRDGRQHVEHHLRGRARLEAGGPCDDFGADDRRDDQIDIVL